MSLPRKAVEEDQELESRASSASEALMQHRWHWTLDETNEKRVSLRAYASAVGRVLKTIQAYANGYALMKADGGASVTPNEAMERANMGAETKAAVEAVAKAHGIKFQTARRSRGEEVRRVRETAGENAEKNGTTIEEEAKHAALTTCNATSDRGRLIWEYVRDHGPVSYEKIIRDCWLLIPPGMAIRRNEKRRVQSSARRGSYKPRVRNQDDTYRHWESGARDFIYSILRNFRTRGTMACEDGLWRVTGDRHREAERQERDPGEYCVAVLESLEAVKHRLFAALNDARNRPWDEDKRELLAARVAEIRGVMGMFDMVLAGAVEVDWDTELASLRREA
jgi:hypothetical protein